MRECGTRLSWPAYSWDLSHAVSGNINTPCGKSWEWSYIIVQPCIMGHTYLRRFPVFQPLGYILKSIRSLNMMCHVKTCIGDSRNLIVSLSDRYARRRDSHRGDQMISNWENLWRHQESTRSVIPKTLALKTSSWSLCTSDWVSSRWWRALQVSYFLIDRMLPLIILRLTLCSQSGSVLAGLALRGVRQDRPHRGSGGPTRKVRFYVGASTMSQFHAGVKDETG